MKKYNRAQEKKNSLNSVINYTTLGADEKTGEQSKVSSSRKSKRRASDCDRKDYGKGRNKSGRGSSKNRRTEKQCKQNCSSEASCECRFFVENGRKYRSRGRTQDQETEILTGQVDHHFGFLGVL